MNRAALLEYVRSLDAEVEAMFHGAEKLVSEFRDSDSEDFKVVASVVLLFKHRAEEWHNNRSGK